MCSTDAEPFRVAQCRLRAVAVTATLELLPTAIAAEFPRRVGTGVRRLRTTESHGAVALWSASRTSKQQ